jgi:hypothetical protein
MFNRIMQVQAEYTPQVQKYKQPSDDAPDSPCNAVQRRRRLRRQSVGVRPDQRRKARVNALEFA